MGQGTRTETLADLASFAMELAPGEGAHATPLPGLLVIRSDGRTLPTHAVYRPSLCLVLQGAKEVVMNGQVFQFQPGRFLIVSIDLPITSHVLEASPGKPFLCLALDLDPDLVFGLLQGMGQAPEPALSEPGIHLSAGTPELLDAFRRLLRCLGEPADAEVLGPMLRREITYRLLKTEYGPVVRQLGVAGSRVQRIAKAVARLRERFDEPLKIEELAHLVNMSPSSFFKHFKQITTLSPLQFQKELRLQEARRLLRVDGLDAATAGFRVGYESPSHFSREYTRHFGLPPIRDIRAADQEGFGQP
jgi:AraC-like DNA-binding protein